MLVNTVSMVMTARRSARHFVAFSYDVPCNVTEITAPR